MKEKYPGFKHKGYSDFSLNPLEALQGCHFPALRDRSQEQLGATTSTPPVQPSPLLSLTNKEPLRARQRQCAPSSGEAPTAHTYPAARDPPSLRDTSSPGAECKSQGRCVTAHVDRSAVVRPPGSAPSNGSQNSNLSTSACDPEDTTAPPLPGDVNGGRLRLRRGFWCEFRRVRKGRCAGLAKKTTPCPARPGRRAECTSHPPTGRLLKIGLPMLMRTRAKAFVFSEPSPVRNSFASQFSIVLKDPCLALGMSVFSSEGQNENFNPKCLEFLKGLHLRGNFHTDLGPLGRHLKEPNWKH